VTPPRTSDGCSLDDDYGLPSNPALGVRVSRRRGDTDEPEKVKVLEYEQLTQLLDALPEETRLFFDFLFETGLRIGEAVELRWGDVDTSAGRLSVDRQFSRGRLRKPKGDKKRKVRLSSRMTLELRSLRGARHDDQLVFTADRGGRLIPSNMMRRNAMTTGATETDRNEAPAAALALAG
jgi:integrase